MLKMIQGKVIRGDGLGQKLGYPTANLDTTESAIPDGVYAGRVTVADKEYAVAVIAGVQGKLEVHILDWQGDLYGQTLQVTVEAKVRELTPYQSDAQMKKQIDEDLQAVVELLKK